MTTYADVRKMLSERPRILVFGMISAVFVTIVVALSATSNAWLCNMRAKNFGSVVDSLERYIIVGYGDKAFCPLPGKAMAHETRVNKPVTIWLRSVFYDHVATAGPDTQVTLEVINAMGKQISLETPGLMLNPTKITTNSARERGFYGGPIVFIAPAPDVYRIRAIYQDRELTTFSLGPPIIVH